jgi:hypothetical protein
MHRTLLSILPILFAILLSACATRSGTHSSGQRDFFRAESSLQSIEPTRMLIWTARLSLEVNDVSEAVAQATSITDDADGYVESKTETGERNARLTLRVPSGALEPLLDSLEGLGRTTSRRVSSEGVTDQYVDTDARLQTKIALRDRLTALLDRADNVQDILAIERELGRIQADIDSMQARLAALEAKADLATIHLSVDRRRVLGPVGYVFKGAWWTVEKLFVIRR